MPKIIDHAQRRRDLIDAALRIIIRQGLSGATMRDIAEEAGFANGAIKPYFANKAELLEATYIHVFESTNRRVRQATRSLVGLPALEAFAREVLPVNAALQDEARVVLSFWGEVAQDPVHAEVTQSSMEQWRRQLVKWLEEARDAGELAHGVNIALEAEVLITHMMGAQVTSIAGGERFDGKGFTRQLEYYLARLSA